MVGTTIVIGKERMESSKRFVWRVRDPDGATRPDAFDAVLLPSNPTVAEPVRHCGLAVPFEAEHRDRPVTLVVRARPGVGPVLVECVVLAADGSQVCAGWSTDTETLIIRSPHHLEVRRMPPSEPDPFVSAT